MHPGGPPTPPPRTAPSPLWRLAPRATLAALALLLALGLPARGFGQDAEEAPDASVAAEADAGDDDATPDPRGPGDEEPDPDEEPEPPDTPPSDPTLDLVEPYRTQVLTLRSDDAEAVAALLDLDPASLDTPDGVKARKRAVLSEQSKLDAELSLLNEELDALRLSIERLEADQADQANTHGRDMLDALRLSAMRRERDAVQARADAIVNRLFVVHDELSFYDRRAEELELLAAKEEKDANAAPDTREVAEREKKRAAQDRQATEKRLEQAEAEREAAKKFEKEYQELAQLEPQILEEKLYIEARRQYELSAQLEEQANRNSAFSAYQDKVDQSIKTFAAKIDRREEPEKTRAEALKLYNELKARRATARREIEDFQLPIRLVEGSLDEVSDDLEEARDAVNRLNTTYREDPSNQMARKRLSVAQARLERYIAYELLLELKSQILSDGLEESYSELLYAREKQEALLPLIPEDARESVFSITTDNFAEVPNEFGDFWLATRHYISERIKQSGQLADKAFSLDGIVWIFKLLFVLAVIVFLIRFIRRHRDEWLKRFSEWAMKQRTLRRRRNLVVKFFEVLNAVLTPLSVLILVQFALSLFPEDAPLVVIATVLINSTLIYLIIINIIKTMILPRWYRQAQSQAESTEDETDTVENHLPEGADLLDLNVQVALFIVSTLRWMLLYTLICQYSLYLVRSAFGMFFVAHWVAFFGYLGYVVVIYILLSRWRDAIAGRFASLVESRSPQAVAFVNTHKDRFYGVGVIFGALLYVLGLEGYARARRYFSNLAVANQIRNFFFRKRIEMGAEGAKASREPPIEKLPPEYRRLFGEKPLIDEPFFVPRSAAEDTLNAIRDEWVEYNRVASVALVGELGMGKTSLLNHLRRQWEAKGDPVLMDVMPARLTSEKNVVHFLGRLLGADNRDLTAEELVQHILTMEPTTVVVDDCHNVFLRKIGGFVALDAFRKIVRLTDQRLCWILVFNRYAWKYIEQVTDASKHFGHVVSLEALSDAEIRELVEQRTSQTDFTLDFSNLILEDDYAEDQWVEFSRTARGYYRLLCDHARGNPRVALHHWLKSLTLEEGDATLKVSLFHTRSTKPLSRVNDGLKFALAAIIQHDTLTIEELARVVNSTYSDASIAMNYFTEHGFVELDPRTGRARVTAAYYRQTLNHLGANNFLQK